MTTVLEAKKLSKKFLEPTPTEILKEISLAVQAGETVAIMGKSGEGKTTLLHILGALETPSSGELLIAGNTLSNSNKAQLLNTHIGFVFQSFHLLEDYTVLENVLMPARIGRKNMATAEKHARALLEEVGLSHRLNHYTKLLSGGEKQRVAIARALCNNPELILADEPTGNLDQQSSEIISNLLFSNISPHKALIMVTHDPDLAARCSRTLVLQNGLISEPKPPAAGAPPQTPLGGAAPQTPR